jgi:hypothetical protein
MKLSRFLLLCALTGLLFTSIIQQLQTPLSRAATITNVPLTFHAYQEIIDNNSSYIYDGVDGCAPQLSLAHATTVEAHIHGTIDYPPFVYNMSFWNGQVTWNLTQPLSADLHVQGMINMSVWVSSTDELNGFFTGSGYGGAITDLDDMGNVVQIFEFPFAEKQGANIFSPTPTEYHMSLDLDYIFAQDHTILFSFGFGANVEGLTATIYFDAPDRHSGVILPVRDLTISFCEDPPAISVTPTSWTETLDVNTTHTQSFIIENQGTGRLYITSIAETVPWLSVSNNPAPLWIQSKDTTSIQVEMYAANQREILNTILIIESNDPDQPLMEIPITMKVGIIDDPPSVSIEAPTEAVVNEEIHFQVVADDDNGITAISAYFEGAWQTQNCSRQQNCSVSWIIMKPVPGTYSYLARAQDTVGQWSNVSEHQITVLATNTVRDVRIVEYTVPTTIAPGATVAMSAVIDNQGTRQETTNLIVTLNSTILYQEAISLNPSETFTHTWQWTAIDREATATLHLMVDPLPGETLTEDNEVTILIQISDTTPWLIPAVGMIAVSGIITFVWYRSRK